MFKMVRRTFLKLLAVVSAALARLVYLASSDTRGRTMADSGAQVARRIQLSAIAVTVGEIELTWKSSLPAGSVSRYSILRNATLLATVEGASNVYNDTAVTPGKRFIYTVIAYDAAGVALATSPPARAVTPNLAPYDIWPPAPPEDLTATAFPGYILLDWFYGNDDTDITCYLITRNGQRLARVDSGTLEFRDATVRPSSAYVYTVQAIDTMGNRSTVTSVGVRSSALTVTTEGQPSEPTQFPAPYAVYLPIIANTPSEDVLEDTPTMGTLVYSSRLRRYPYLTDLVGPYVTINWATDTSSTTGFVTYGLVGSELPTAHTVPATRSSISVNGVSEYQWKAILTLTPDTQYAYRIFLDSSTPTDLLGSDPSPTFWTQIPGGSSKPFSFIVIGDWGDASNGAAEQASLMPLIAQSGALFGFTTGDNAYSSGSQTNYGDLVETGSSVSGVFGPQGWTIPGRSLPLFPVLGNHGISNSDSAGNSHLLNWPQGMAAQLSNGRYVSEFYGGIDGTTPRNYPSTWFAFDAGIARFYVLKAAWGDTNTGNASSVYQVDYDYHWTPSSAEYQWLANDLATHPSTLKFAFFHYPLYSDNASQESDTYLQGPNSLEGLLINNGVNLAFYGHAHYYQRNVANGLTSYLVGASGVKLQRMDGGCSSVDAYALGWSNSQNQGYACGSAPVPTSKSQVYHFLKVSVNGATVTVTPMNALGQPFDIQVFNFGSGATPTPIPTPTDTQTPTSVPPTSTNTPEPTLTATPTTAPPTPTDTPTPTSVPPTSTNTPEPTLTATPTTAPPTPTDTPTPTSVPPTPMPTDTPTPEPTLTATPTSTNTPTATATSTPTPTPGGSAMLVAQGSVWRYLDNGSNQGDSATPVTSTNWRSPAFNDSTWVSGPAPLGYSSSPSNPITTTVSYGPNSSNKYRTTYFRRTFNVTNPNQFASLTLQLRRDDGAVVYLNGIEVVRSNMPTGAVTYQTFAASTVDGANETTFFSYTIPASTLVTGTNILAVEIHQRTASSSDIAFDLRLDAGSSSGTPTPVPTATSTGVPATSIPTATSTPTSGGGSVLVARGSAWRYLDNGSNQGDSAAPVTSTNWRSPAFNDAAWASGPAPLGYGSTSLNISTTVTSGPITTYFRRTFNVTNPGQYSMLTLQLRRDDGAVVYLNGVEIARSNMPTGTVAYQTLASSTVSGTNEMAFFTYAIPVSALVAGNNTLAVEIHQRAASSSDIVFDLELEAVA